MDRIGRTRLHMDMALLIAQRATCDRARVGCLLARDDRIISTGYNGAVRAAEHCDDVGHMMEGDHCVRAVHAEQNVLIQAALNETSPSGAILYTTHFPCIVCAKMLVNSGIQEIYFSYYVNSTESMVKPIRRIFDGSFIQLRHYNYDTRKTVRIGG